MSPCREWTKAKTRGYGIFRHRGRTRYVHRIAWMREYGPIPKGMLIMHLCDNPACYNIEHLQLGTDADNHADKARKDSVQNRGLTRAEVNAIRMRLLSGESQHSIAADFPISRSAVRNIKLGKSYSYWPESRT